MIAAIDHLLSLVENLEVAAAAAVNLGFTLTPRGLHPQIATANRLIMHPACYWELLSVVRPMPQNEWLSQRLGVVKGVAGIAIATCDMAESRRRARAAGICTHEPMVLRRPVRIDDAQLDAWFKISDLEVPTTVRARFFLCEHLTPELVWRSEWTVHGNEAVALCGLIAVADHPEQLERDLAALFSTAVPRESAERISAGSGVQIICMTPAELTARYPDLPCAATVGPAFPAIIIRLANTARLRMRLADSTHAVQETAHGFALTLAELGHTTVEFVSAG